MQTSNRNRLAALSILAATGSLRFLRLAPLREVNSVDPSGIPAPRPKQRDPKLRSVIVPPVKRSAVELREFRNQRRKQVSYA